MFTPANGLMFNPVVTVALIEPPIAIQSSPTCTILVVGGIHVFKVVAIRPALLPGCVDISTTSMLIVIAFILRNSKLAPGTVVFQKNWIIKLGNIGSAAVVLVVPRQVFSQ